MKKINLIKIIREEVKSVLNEMEFKPPRPEIFKDGGNIIEYFDTIPAFRKYRVKDADEIIYDTPYYIIPAQIFKRVLPEWTKEKVEYINSQIDTYDGGIDWNETNPNHHLENTIIVMSGE